MHAERPAMGQKFQLCRALDPFGHDLQPEAVAERDNGAHDRRGARVGIDALDEHAIEFHPRDGELLQRGQRGIADSEVVQCELQAPVMQPGQRAQSLGFVTDQHAFGDLEFQPPACQIFLGEHVHDQVCQVVRPELRRRSGRDPQPDRR